MIFIGAKVGIEAKNGYTPLHWAAQDGCVECVRELVLLGEDVDKV